MIPTSDERRKVAERLREQAYEGYGVNLESMLYALGLDSDDEGRGDEDVFEMLADLIDPTCKVVRKKVYAGGPQMYKTLWCCSECGFPLAESKCKGHVQFVAENFCPRCGARVAE